MLLINVKGANDVNETKIPKIDTWTRKNEEDAYATSDGKNLLLNIEKIIPNSIKRMPKEYLDGLNFMKTFIIERKLFFKKTDLICQYIDYFIEFFDPEKELPLVYLSLKEVIDSNIKTLTMQEFLKLLTMRFFHDTQIKKHIYELVEYNYDLDVTIDEKTGRVFEGLYDFNNEEAKVLLAISVFMKFVIPITSQYINTTDMYTADELNSLVTSVFVEAFYRMGDYKDVEADEVLVKLYKFTETKILKHYGVHSVLWNQQCALRGLTESMHVDTILIKHLLSNNMFKFKFDNNIISFLKSIVETQLICTINKLKYKANPVKIETEKNYNGLSGIDKLEQSMAKLDETMIIRCERAIEYEFNRLEKELGEIDGEEHAYYMEHFLLTCPFHKMIVDYFFAKEFGGYTELKNVSAEQYVDLVIYAKRKTKLQGYKELPDLISSNMEGKMSQRLLQNSKYITKYSSSETYQDLKNNKYKCLNGYNETAILDIASKTLNNVFVYVDYDNQERTGEQIEFNEDIISDEIFNFVDMI